MLTRDDLKRIGGLMDEKFGDFELRFEQKMDKKMDEKFIKFEDRVVDRIIGDVGEMFEQNFLPAVDVLIEDKLAPIKAEVAGIRGDIVGVQSSMVTKDYLDRKLAPMGGKINILVDVLHCNGTIFDDKRRIVHA